MDGELIEWILDGLGYIEWLVGRLWVNGGRKGCSE